MRQVLLIAVMALVSLTACKDKKGQVLDPDAKISLRPAQGVKAENPNHLTAKEIVEQATDIWFWNYSITTANALGRGFAPSQRDLVNFRLLMWGTDIISREGKYISEFIESEDVILTKEHSDFNGMDTIGYIPNAVLRTAQPLIKMAHSAGDYAKCYELFDKAFTFIPITGAEWLELKRQGLN